MAKQDAIALLKADHAAAVKKLFLQGEKAAKHNGHGNDGDRKEEIFNQIMAALTIHAAIEEEIFYPAVKKVRAEHVKESARSV
jgi:hemerythrin superfamily protein